MRQVYNENITSNLIKKGGTVMNEIEKKVAEYKAALLAEEAKKKAEEAKKKAEEAKRAAEKDTSGFWDKEILVGVIESSTKKSATKVKVTSKDGLSFLDIRGYVHKKGSTQGYKQHTNKGLSIEFNSDKMIDALIKALQLAKGKGGQ